jgi:hypothetical protein
MTDNTRGQGKVMALPTPCWGLLELGFSRRQREAIQSAVSGLLPASTRHPRVRVNAASRSATLSLLKIPFGSSAPE